MTRNRPRIIIALVILLAAAVPLARLITAKRNDNGRPTRAVSPVLGDISSEVTATGIVEPQNRLEIKPSMGGRIESILVKEGEKVKTGDTLAWMSSTERAALVDAARSQGKETLKYWEEVYKQTPIISPIDGEVIVRSVEPGQTVAASDAVLVLSDRLIVKAQFDETDIGKVKVGQKAIISLDAYPDVKLTGIVDHIAYESKVVNNVTIYEVEILPENVPSVFRSGMSANISVIEDKKEGILIIPVEAVKQDKDGSYVLLGNDNGRRPVKRGVKLGISDGVNTEVVSGLTAEDKILIEAYVPAETKRAGSPFMPSRR